MDDGHVLLRVDGTHLVTGDGTPVTLRGVGLGGWMNMENFITGYPSTESQQRQALREALGRGGLRARSSTRSSTAFFTDADAAFLASLGLNSRAHPVQLPALRGRRPALRAQGGGLPPASTGWSTRARRHGIYTILDLHAAARRAEPALAQRQPDALGAVLDAPALPGPRRAPVGGDRRPLHGQAVGRRLQPDQRAGRRRAARSSGPFYRRLEAAIRAVDPRPHPVPRRQPLLHRLRHARRPAAQHGLHRARLRAARLPRRRPLPRRQPRAATSTATSSRRRSSRARSTCARTGTPIWIGEFGPVYTGDPERDEQRYRLLRGPARDLRASTTRAGRCGRTRTSACRASSTRAPDSPYVRRIAARAGEEGPAGRRHAGARTDAGRAAHPATRSRRPFAEEFPDYDPFPWGSQRWVHLIVRHILLAEPMVADFGRCFEGLSPDEAEALADSFRLDRCVQRRRLVEILRARRETSTPASTSG